MQRCLITGANRGLGLAFTRQLLMRRARVLACCRDLDQAEDLRKLREEHPDHLILHALDVTDSAAIAALPKAAEKHLHGIDLLINNAGVLVSGERFGNVEAQSLARSFAVNATAPLLITQALEALLLRGKNPRVLCISSQLGSITQASSFQTPSYAMSKAALNMGVKRLAAELGSRGIVVLACHPGWMKTTMGGKNATLAPEESAKALLDLIAHARVEDGGKFLAYDGAELPW